MSKLPPLFVSFPRVWLALATGILMGLALPALTPGSTPSDVTPAQQLHPAAPAHPAARPADGQDQASDDSDDPALPYNDDDPDEA